MYKNLLPVCLDLQLKLIKNLTQNVRKLTTLKISRDAEVVEHFKTLLGFEQEETEEDFYLLAKSLASKTAESLEEATHIELKDNQVTKLQRITRPRLAIRKIFDIRPIYAPACTIEL